MPERFNDLAISAEPFGNFYGSVVVFLGGRATKGTVSEGSGTTVVACRAHNTLSVDSGHWAATDTVVSFIGERLFSLGAFLTEKKLFLK